MFPKRKLKTDLKKFSFFLLIFSCLFVNSVLPSDEIDLFDKTEGDSLKLAKSLELLKQDRILSDEGIDVPMPESGNYKIISVSYNVVQVVEGTVEVTSLRPEKFELSQNYPNPFNGGATIRFALPQDTRVKITCPGYHKITWDGRNDCMKKAASGMYIYTMESKKFRAVKKMLYVK